jgi:Spy/CpxP family protein refolding chaperone
MGMDPARRLQMLQDRLNLTADQSTQIKAILDDGQTKMQALRANTALSQDDRRSQSMALRNDENTKIEAVLTADQKTQYEQILAQQRDRMRNGGGPGGPGGDGSAPPPPPPPPGA